MNLNNVTQSLRIREYYYMALRHKMWFVSIITASVLISSVIAFSMPKIFRAETVLLVEGEKLLNPLISGLAVAPSVAARMRTLREDLLSWQRLLLLVEKLKLDKGIKSPIEQERLMKKLRENITIKLRGQDIITIFYEGEDPKSAQNIVQTLSDIIIDGNLTSSNLEANSAISFIDEQLNTYRKKLEASEEKLREFREIYNSTLPVATRMNEQLVNLKIELSNLLVDNTELHPRVVQTRELIKQIEIQRNEFMEQAKKDGAAIENMDYAKLVSSVPLQEQQLAKLQRDYAVNESIYQKLLQRLETAKISETLEASSNGTKFRILEPARLPLEPVKPNKTLFLIGGLIVGAGIAALLVYLIEMSNNSFRNVEEARNILELPIYGSIGAIRSEELLMGERLREEVGV
jgi:polysaccharide biosynthesis transport protein